MKTAEEFINEYYGLPKDDFEAEQFKEFAELMEDFAEAKAGHVDTIVIDRVLTGEWRVNDNGIFCGTLRVGKIDFDTNPSGKMKSLVYQQMQESLNTGQ